MKRVWRNLSKGKKIAGLVAICLAVVLGYFGYHRLTSQAEGQISKGVINDIAQLPKNMEPLKILLCCWKLCLMLVKLRLDI